MYNFSDRSGKATLKTARSLIPDETNLAGDEESDGDTGVDVSTADVSDHPDNRGHAETERQRDLDNIARLCRVELGARAAGDDDQQKSADKFGQQRLIELDRRQILLV